jgi:hypothetical protein
MEVKKCIVCNATENEVPIIKLAYKGQELGICPAHIPLLIHNPENLVGVIDGAENMKGV